MDKDYIVYFDENFGVVFDNDEKKIYKISKEFAHKIRAGEVDLQKVLAVKDYNTFVDEHISRMQLIMTTSCNLNCRYCYADGGNYGLREEYISIEVLNRAIDYLKNNNISKVLFFGGEPLLAFEQIKFFLDATSDIEGLKYAMVSNLTIMNEQIMRLLKNYKIALTVSLDGPKCINDQNRMYASGKGTFDIVKSNIEYLISNAVAIRKIECTYGEVHKKYGMSKDLVINYFKDLFPDIPVEICDEKRCGSCEYDELSEADYIRGWFLKKSNTFCAAGKRNIAICPNGDVYPCQLFINKEEFKMGNILEGIEKRGVGTNNLKKLKEEFGCSECSARNLCSKCLGDIVNSGVEPVKAQCERIVKDNERAIINFVSKRSI